MKRFLLSIAVTLALFGCGTMQSSSPEAQIAAGANAVAATATLATVAFKNDKISITQAKQTRAVLVAASGTLDDANAVLIKCRKDTGSTSATRPDPCVQTTVGLITLAIDTIASAKRMLDAAK